MITDFELMELLLTKFSHDLSGPIGAVNNGVEFLHDSNTALHANALELIDLSAKKAVGRLQFFRQAYGIVPAVGEANLAQLKHLTKQFFFDTKVQLDWPDAHTESTAVSSKLGKLTLNVIHICSTCLIQGGTLSFRIEKSAQGKCLKVSGTGPKLKSEEDLLEILTCKLDSLQIPINPRNVQFYFTAKLAQSIHTQVTYEYTSDIIHFYLNHPH